MCYIYTTNSVQQWQVLKCITILLDHLLNHENENKNLDKSVIQVIINMYVFSYRSYFIPTQLCRSNYCKLTGHIITVNCKYCNYSNCNYCNYSKLYNCTSRYDDRCID